MRKLKRTYVHYWAQHQWRQCVACRYCHYTCRGQLKYDGTRTETRFRLSAKRASLFKSLVGGVSSVGYWQPRCAASAVVMLDTPCSEVVWRVLPTHCFRQFPPSLPLPCVTVWRHIVTFKLFSFQTNPYPFCTAPLLQSKQTRSITVCKLTNFRERKVLL